MDGLLPGRPPRSWYRYLCLALAISLGALTAQSPAGAEELATSSTASDLVRLPPAEEDRPAAEETELHPTITIRRLGPSPASEPSEASEPFDREELLEPNEATEPTEALDTIQQPNRPASTSAANLLWWDAFVRQPLDPAAAAKPIALEEVLLGALNHSAQIRVIQEVPLIRQTAIQEAQAEFDWLSFVESQWLDTSEPVGNVLTTGGPRRFRDDYLSASAGVRRRNRMGGKFEIAQRIGHQQNNSVFFDPPNQGTSRLTLSYTQPLLRGAGQTYNTSLTVLAEMDTAASHDEVSGRLQAHLLAVAKAYWELYLERGLLLQKRQLHTQASSVLRELERRRNIDALHSQIIRARAAVESRRADIVRGEMSVRNAESRIRSLVNDPTLGDSQQGELIPTLPPLQHRVDVDLPGAVETAWHNRPEVAQAIKQIQAAGVRLKMSRNEVLPAVNLVLETYVAGLRGDSDIGTAWLDQYREGEPSYSIGLQYERPFGNRLANARMQRRTHELRQLQAELQATLEAVRLEVEVAVREIQTTYGEMEANYRAMEAAAVEVDYISDRWQLLPDSDRSASVLLEHLLQAQERLNAAESAFLHAQLNYSLSQMTYRRATGMLLQAEEITGNPIADSIQTTGD